MKYKVHCSISQYGYYIVEADNEIQAQELIEEGDAPDNFISKDGEVVVADVEECNDCDLSVTEYDIASDGTCSMCGKLKN